MGRAYLGPVPHLAVGVRLPDVVAPPVLKAFRARDSVGGLMLSFNRETAPRDVIEGGGHVLLGHTGTSIAEYVGRATELAEVYGALVEVEADHVSLMASPERAIKRITGGGFEYGLSDEEVRRSLSYIEREFREVRDAGGVDFVTIDTCELIDLSVERVGGGELAALYEERFDEGFRRGLEDRYVGRSFKFFTDSGVYVVRFGREDVARLALKLLRSVEHVKVVYDLVRGLNGRAFGVEVALDETPYPTSPKELVFYLNELRAAGVDPDFVAPNIGFRKREDFTGDLRELAERVEVLHSIATSFGSLLSIHSGSGAHPYSDKGLGTWEVLWEVTGGWLKYKVSGVYVQLLLEVMSRFPRGSRPRRLYEEVFDAVYEYLVREVRVRGPLYTPHLEGVVKRCDPRARNPREDLFRHYFFLFQALSREGRRYLREEVLELYRGDEGLRREYEREAYELTLRIIDKLGFTGNYLRYRVTGG